MRMSLLYNLFLSILLSTGSVPLALNAQRSEYWGQRVSLFEKLPIDSDDIVFIGNSIIDGGEFSELFCNPDIKNRGINSDDIPGVIERIPTVLKGKPSKIFLLIGINDISHSLPLDTLVERYERLVGIIRKGSGSTRLYLQSVMPINNDFARYKNLKGKENLIISLNNEIKKIADRYDAVYLDLWGALAIDGSDKLNPRFTNDGLHLTGDGYMAWKDCIWRYVCE